MKTSRLVLGTTLTSMLFCACAEGPEFTADELASMSSTEQAITLPTITALAAAGDWDNPATWEGGQVPTADNPVIIPADKIVTKRETGSFDRAADMTIDGRLILEDTMIITAGSTVTLSGNIPAGQYAIDQRGSVKNIQVNGTLYVNAPLMVSGSYAALAVGSNGALYVGSKVTNSSRLSNSGTVGVSYGAVIDGTGKLVNSGTMSLLGSVTSSNSSATNSGTITINRSSGFAGTMIGRFTSTAKLANVAGGTINNYEIFDNFAEVANQGTVYNATYNGLTRPVTYAGTFDNHCQGSVTGNPITGNASIRNSGQKGCI